MSNAHLLHTALHFRCVGCGLHWKACTTEDSYVLCMCQAYHSHHSHFMVQGVWCGSVCGRSEVRVMLLSWPLSSPAEGPYLIAADTVNRETVYLSVNEDDMSLQAAAEKEKASEFLVLMTEQGTKANEFHIVYIGKSKTAKQGYRQPIMAPPDRPQDEDIHEASSDCEGKQYKPPYRYLSAPLSIDGTNYGPLYFELNPKKQHTMFVLHSRLRTRGAPAEVLGPWVQGHEGYFINCHARKFARDGYLAVRRVIKDGSERYCPVCVPSHRSTEDYFKVFSLVRPPMKKQRWSKMEAEDSM